MGPCYQIGQWFPNSGRDPNQGREGSDVRSRECLTEISIIIKKNKNLYLNSKRMNVFINFRNVINFI
jgi:hypothetical protein